MTGAVLVYLAWFADSGQMNLTQLSTALPLPITLGAMDTWMFALVSRGARKSRVNGLNRCVAGGVAPVTSGVTASSAVAVSISKGSSKPLKAAASLGLHIAASLGDTCGAG